MKIIQKSKKLKVKFSNTGKTITIRLPNNYGHKRVHVYYSSNYNCVTITPSSSGYAINKISNCVTFPSSKFPEWVFHKLVELEGLETNDPGSFLFKLDLVPDNFLIPREDVESKYKVTQPSGDIRSTIKEVNSNCHIQLDGKSYDVTVPPNELYPLILDWYEKGYIKLKK